jgi:hypothetical protein
MIAKHAESLKSNNSEKSKQALLRQLGGVGGLLLVAAALPHTAAASENVPHRPFAQWADVPAPGQLVAGLVYEESEAYHVWYGNKIHDITREDDGEHYGIDINQGYVALQYGITEKWAADFNLGATTAGWRTFDDGHIQSTTGVMDWSFGIRYQIFNEANTNQSPWLPTLTFRAGAVMPGSYDEHFAFAPGLRSAAIEPNLLARKHFGWPGFGAYSDSLFRWNRTTGNDQYITSIGLFQQFKGWELDAGFRHLHTLGGKDIQYPPSDGSEGNNPDNFYPRDPREISEAIEAGFSYTTSKRHIRYGFHSRTIVDGSNTDNKFWVGGSIDVPFDNFLGRFGKEASK